MSLPLNIDSALPELELWDHEVNSDRPGRMYGSVIFFANASFHERIKSEHNISSPNRPHTGTPHGHCGGCYLYELHLQLSPSPYLLHQLRKFKGQTTIHHWLAASLFRSCTCHFVEPQVWLLGFSDSLLSHSRKGSAHFQNETTRKV